MGSPGTRKMGARVVQDVREHGGEAQRAGGRALNVLGQPARAGSQAHQESRLLLTPQLGEESITAITHANRADSPRRAQKGRRFREYGKCEPVARSVESKLEMDAWND